MKTTTISLPILFLLFMSCVGGAASNGQNKKNSEPNWVRDPYARHDRQAYVAAVGIASSRDLAEKNALGNLIAVFGQSI